MAKLIVKEFYKKVISDRIRCDEMLSLTLFTQEKMLYLLELRKISFYYRSLEN